MLQRNKLYSIIGCACLAGYSWLYYLFFIQTKNDTYSVCLFKKITSIPCPSCGSSRSVVAILSGNFSTAFYLNPLGFVLVPFILILPLWLMYDLLNNSDTLLKHYLYFEKKIINKKIAIPLILLITLNWIWNIKKGL